MGEMGEVGRSSLSWWISSRRTGYLKVQFLTRSWVWYYKNGQLLSKGTLKDGKWDGPWVFYNKDGTVRDYLTGTYKNGKKVK